MGMFDSFYIRCPKCGNELEFQSKSGACALLSYRKSNLSPDVAIGIDGDIVECQFCKTNFKLKCNLPKRVQVKLISTKEKARYPGNYNPDLLKNKIKATKLKMKYHVQFPVRASSNALKGYLNCCLKRLFLKSSSFINPGN